MEHAHQHVGCARRIGQRPEDVEDGAHAQFLADRGNVLHRRMVVGREHEADAGFLETLADLLGRQHDVGAERLEHIGRARLGGHAAVAVLGDAGAGGRHHEHRSGRYVEGVRAVAAGTDDIDEMRPRLADDLAGELAHHLGGGGHLADGLLLDPQARDQRTGHHRRHFAAHDHAHQVQHLVVEDLAVLDRALKRFLWGYRHLILSRNWQAVDGHVRWRWIPDGTERRGPATACAEAP